MRPHLKKNPSQKRAGRVAQDEDLEYRPQNHQKQKKSLLHFKLNKEMSKFCSVRKSASIFAKGQTADTSGFEGHRRYGN
jgi:hypothetical protein